MLPCYGISSRLPEGDEIAPLSGSQSGANPLRVDLSYPHMFLGERCGQYEIANRTRCRMVWPILVIKSNIISLKIGSGITNMKIITGLKFSSIFQWTISFQLCGRWPKSRACCTLSQYTGNTAVISCSNPK